MLPNRTVYLSELEIFFAIADALNHAGPNKIVQLVHISVIRQDSRDQNPGAFELPSLRNVKDFWLVGISSTELCEPEPLEPDGSHARWIFRESEFCRLR